MTDPAFHTGAFIVIHEKTNHVDGLVLKAGDKAVTWTYTPILCADGQWKCVPNSDLKIPDPSWPDEGTGI